MNPWPTVLQAVQSLFLPALTAVGVGIGTIAGIWMNRWKKAQDKRDAIEDLERAKNDLDRLREYSQIAVNAVEQMYKDVPGTEKAKLAMAWTQHLATAAHIDPKLLQPNQVVGVQGNQPSIPRIMMENNVLPLSKKEEVKGEG